MAKNSIPMPSGGGLLPKVIGILMMFAVLALVVQHPTDAAQWLNQSMGMLGGIIDGLASFLRQVLA